MAKFFILAAAIVLFCPKAQAEVVDFSCGNVEFNLDLDRSTMNGDQVSWKREGDWLTWADAAGSKWGVNLKDGTYRDFDYDMISSPGNCFPPDVAKLSSYGGRDLIAESFNRLPRSSRISVQEKLAEGGFYRRGIDGAFGPGTRSAILNAAVFLKDNSYGRVVYDFSSSSGIKRFLADLAAGKLDNWLWGEGDESEG